MKAAQEPQKPYVLKILSGPHLGAEVLIREGLYVIGSQEACDIVLSDESVASRHVSLSISGGTLALSTLDGAVYIDGEGPKQTLTTILPFQIVTIGTTHFSIGPAGERWPPLKLPEIPGPEKTEPPSKSAALVSPAKETRPKGASIRLLLSSSVFFAGVLSLSIFLVSFSKEPSHGKSFSALIPTAPIEKARTIIAELGLSGVEAFRLENGRLMLKGSVETLEEKQTLMESIKRRMDDRPLPAFHITVNEQVAGMCNDTLAALGLPLEATSEGPGKIILTGFILDEERLDRGIEVIKQDLPFIEEIDNRVMTPNNLVQEIYARLSKAGFKGKIDFALHPDHILATGLLHEDDLRLWSAVKKALSEEYGEHIAIRESFQAAFLQEGEIGSNTPEAWHSTQITTSGDRRFVLPMKSISLGPFPHVLLAQGERLFEGAMIGNGYSIRRIGPDGIIAVKGFETVHIYPGEN